MSFAIEVAGEAAPLGAQQVLQALRRATSSQQQLLQTGAKQLQNWESRGGYFSLLQAAYLDKSLPTDIRYLAVIQLKNGIDKYWRKSATNAISAEEKVHIRQRLLSGGLDESNTQLALQNAIAVSKVVRIDYPQEWPDAINQVIQLLRSSTNSNQLHLRRGLLILLQIIKELATARLRKSQTSLQATTPELVALLSSVYSQKVKQWQAFYAGTGHIEADAIESMENSLLALKTLRRLLISGYEIPHRDNEVQQLWAQSQQQFGQFLSVVNLEPAVVGSSAREIIEKHLFQLAKLHVDMSNIHPASFALLPSSLDLARAYWGLIENYSDIYATSETLPSDMNNTKDRHFTERLSLKGLVLLRACVKMVFSPAQSFKYRSPEFKEEQLSAKELIKTQLLTESFVRQIANVVVTKFFVFRKADLEAWEEEPDAWEIREEGGGDGWEFEIRPCSEKLFMDLVINFKHLLVGPLLGFFNSVAGNSNADVVTKDSVYTAMGLSAPVVLGEFDFDSFLSSTLVNDVQLQGVEYKVLRRRVAILIGQWITIKIEGRALVYPLFHHLLNAEDPTNDIVVRVTAARQLKTVVDDYQFEADDFAPLAAEILQRLMALIKEVEQAEVKMAILDTIRVIAERLEQNIIPFADQIVSILPELWEASGDEHLMKQAILSLLSTLTTALRDEAQRYYPLILPLIRNAITDADMQVYLLEECLELWSAILQASPEPASPVLVDLSEVAFPLLELGSDNLGTALNIIESYVLLAPTAMLADGTRLRLLSYMTSILGVTKRDLAGVVTRIVETLLMAAETLGGAPGIAIVVKDLHESGYTERIMEGLLDAWTCHQTSGPNKRYPKLDDVVETDYFTILARIALADPVTFINLLSPLGELQSTWAWLSTEWFRHFDSMANIARQKLSCLALTRLLDLPPPAGPALIRPRLQDYIAMWTAVCGELMDGRGADGSDSLVWIVGDDDGNEYETREDVRRRQLKARDPVHTLHAYEFARRKLGALVVAVGGEDVFQREWAGDVDKDVLMGFQALGQPGGEMR